jgi:hypothetical protein
MPSLRHRERSKAIQTGLVVDDAEAQHGSAICAISAISNGSVWIATALRASQRRCGLMFAMFLHYTRVIDRVVMYPPASSRAKRRDPEKTTRFADLKRLDCDGASRLAKTLWIDVCYVPSLHARH